MSKIYEALKQVESHSTEDKNPTSTAERLDHRRTSRFNVQVPLFVYGYALGGEPFYEEAHTIAINAHGGLISMRNLVAIGQRLVVINREDEQPQECVVLSVRTQPAYGSDVAFQFPKPMPTFWRDVGMAKEFRRGTLSSLHAEAQTPAAAACQNSPVVSTYNAPPYPLESAPHRSFCAAALGMLRDRLHR